VLNHLKGVAFVSEVTSNNKKREEKMAGCDGAKSTASIEFSFCRPMLDSILIYNYTSKGVLVT